MEDNDVRNQRDGAPLYTLGVSLDGIRAKDTYRSFEADTERIMRRERNRSRCSATSRVYPMGR